MIKMMKRTGHWAFLCLLCSVFCFSSYAQGVVVEQTQLNQISLSLKEELQNLKQSTESLQNDLIAQQLALEEQKRLLTNAEIELSVSKKRLEESMISLQESNTYLLSMNTKFQDCSAKLIRAEHTISILAKINITLAIILGVMLVYKIIAIVLRCRGIKLPWILDLLF